jgi:hypothetical protein
MRVSRGPFCQVQSHHGFSGLFVITLVMLLCETRLQAPLPENLASLVASASNNPEVKSSDARWQMFGTDRPVRSFDDPMLMLKIQNGVVTDPFNFGKPPDPEVIGISQQLRSGKAGSEGRVAAQPSPINGR